MILQPAARIDFSGNHAILILEFIAFIYEPLLSIDGGITVTTFINTYDRDRKSFPMETRIHFESVQVPEGGFTHCPREWNVPVLRYGYHRIYYVIGGEAWYTEADRRVRLQPRHLYIFPSQTGRYGIQHDPENPLEVLWCHFEMFPDFQNDVIDLDVYSDGELLPLIALWRRFAQMPQPGNEVYHILMLILYRLEREGKLRYADFPFAGIERYVYDHLRENLTVEALAEHYGYTRSHFTRIFRDTINLSPGEYLRVLRMSRASNLLRNGMSIGEVCEELGYTDRKVFSRAFSTYHGISPSEYAKKHKSQPI